MNNLIDVVVEGKSIIVKVFFCDGSYTKRVYDSNRWSVVSAVRNAIVEEAYQEVKCPETDVTFYTDEEYDEFYEYED